jgi:hypothetical protein
MPLIDDTQKENTADIEEDKLSLDRCFAFKPEPLEIKSLGKRSYDRNGRPEVNTAK